MPDSTDYRRVIPSVDKILRQTEITSLQSQFGRDLTLQAVQSVLSELRQSPEVGVTIERERIAETINALVATRLDEWTQPTLRPVINATGVILHTNLGRAPLSKAAIEAASEVAAGYSNLEFDLESGKRGSRTIHASSLLTHLTGAEDALVVNNNAAAVLLVLTALAKRKKAAISRTQLVEIGGGFRIPEVMAQSGAHLVEIGTTNRVHLSDYAEALDQGVQIVLRAHHSNFRIIGFTSEPEISEIISLAHAREALFIDDLGSGAMLDTARYGLAHEPIVQESVSSGADLVCFSGDKLLGGPQAGIIVGRKELIDKIRKTPLARAVRADKLCLAALSATLLHYLKDEAEQYVPIWQMISLPAKLIEQRAIKLQKALSQGEVLPASSTIGGGSLPEETLPTFILSFKATRPDEVSLRLRRAATPIIARIEQDRIIIDLRTVLPEQEAFLAEVLAQVLA